MTRNRALNVFLAACSLALLATSILVLRRASTSEVEVDSVAMRPTSHDPQLERALQDRELEIDALKAEVNRLQEHLDEGRKPAEPIITQPLEATFGAQANASRVDARGLAGAVEFLRAALPDRFGKLNVEAAATITELDLKGVKLSDEDLALLASLPELKTLSLRGAAITDAGLAYLRGMSQLGALDLRGTQVTGAGVGQLSGLGLTALHLTDTKVTGAELRWLPSMPDLQTLKLNRCEFGDDSIGNLALFPSVKHLELDGTEITDAGLGQLLAQNTALQRIELRSTAVTPDGVAALRVSYPNVDFVLDDPNLALYGR